MQEVSRNEIIGGFQKPAKNTSERSNGRKKKEASKGI
jgi:hypothetical protein